MEAGEYAAAVTAATGMLFRDGERRTTGEPIHEIVGPHREAIAPIRFIERPKPLDCAAIEANPGRILPLVPNKR